VAKCKRRKAQRVSVINSLVALELKIIGGEVKNISTGGACIETDMPFKENVEIPLMLIITTQDKSFTIKGRGIVKWARSPEPHNSKKGIMGIEFTKIPKSSVKNIQSILPKN